jgi:hypothetical protein
MTSHLPDAAEPGRRPAPTSNGSAVTAAGAGDKLSFEHNIKPFFRQKDRDSMAAAFDLFDYADVVENAEAIVGFVSSGQMACDGAWPAEQVEPLQRSIDLGMPA